MSGSTSPSVVVSGGQTTSNLYVDGSTPGGGEILAGGTVVGAHIGGGPLIGTTPGGGAIAPGGTLTDYGLITGVLVDNYYGSPSVSGYHGGELILQSGGIADNVTLGGGATLVVSNGGFASNVSTGPATVADPGGQIFVYAGGSASNINNDLQVTVSGGTISNTTITSGLFGGEELLVTGSAYANIITGVTASTSVVEAVQVVSGGHADVNNFTGYNADQIVNGGLVTSNNFGAGTAQLVGGAGVASGNVLSAGAEQVVQLGGTVISTTILAGATAVINGGITSNTTIANGGFEIALGGTLNNTTIAAGGTLIALPGAVVNGVDDLGGTVITGGIITLATSGTSTYLASSTVTEAVDIISYTAPPVLVQGLTIDGTQLAFETVTSYLGQSPVTLGVEPTTYIGSGGAADTVTTDGLLYVGGGGQVSNVSDNAVSKPTTSFHTVIVNQNTTELVYSTVPTEIIGTLTAGSGGIASNVNVNGGVMDILAGATVTNVTDGGFTYQWNDIEGVNGNSVVVSTGSATGIVNIAAGATVTNNITVNTLGLLNVAGTDIGAQINGSATVNVEAGGVTTGTHINGVYPSDSSENIYGTASGTVLTTFASETVFSGGIAINTQDENNSQIIVLNGGTIINAQEGLGQIYVSSGGVASATQVLSYGVQTVSSGGIAINTNIGSGTENVLGGTVSGAYTTSRGVESVDSGGKTYYDVISGAYSSETIYNGSATSSFVGQGGLLNLYAGATSGVIVSSGGTESVNGGTDNVTHGTAAATTVLYGGVLAVGGRLGIISGAIVSSGGFINAYTPGLVENTTLGNGALAYFTSGAIGLNLDVQSGGTVIEDQTPLYPAGTLTGITVESGGTLEVTSATNFANVQGVVHAGGVVELGGVTISGITVVDSQLTAPLISGGLTLLAGAQLDYASPVIISGGILELTAGTSAFNIDNEYGGTLVIDAGATAIDFSINRNLVIDNGLLVFGPLPTANGPQLTQYVQQLGGTVTGTGSIEVAANTLLYDGAANSTTGGTSIGNNATVVVGAAVETGLGGFTFGQNAELYLGYLNNNSTFANLLEGLTAGDQIKLSAIGSAGTPLVTLSGNILTVSDGTYTESFTLGGSSLDNMFAVQNASGGAVVTVEPLQITTSFGIGNGQIATSVTIDAGGDAVVASGGIVVNPVINGGTLELGVGSTVSGDISFSGNGGRLVIDGSVPTNTIICFVPGDSVKLTGVPYNPADQVVVNTPGVVTIETPGGNYNLNVAGAFVGETGFTVANDLLLTQSALCYLAGTRILTLNGEVAVEDLAIGDKVVTRFGAAQTIKWIGRQTYDPRFISNNHNKIPVRIAAGALGAGLPRRDLLISPGHSVLLEGTLLLGFTLVNGVTITQTPPTDTVSYYQIDLLTHDCVLAEGLWAESYADAPGMRAQFHNAAEFAALYPDYVAPEELQLCAPRPQEGAALSAALTKVVERAALGITPGMIGGHIDYVTPAMICGWAQDKAHPQLPVMVEILCHGEVIGRILACDYRGDLAEAGLALGRCAFNFVPQTALSPKDLAGIAVRVAASTLHLPRSTAAAA